MKHKIYEWLPEFVFDDKGNCCIIIYSSENNLVLMQGQFTLGIALNQIAREKGNLKYTNVYLDKDFICNKTPYKKFESNSTGESDFLF